MIILNYQYSGLPIGAIYIGRAMLNKGLERSLLANPYRIGPTRTRAQALKLFEALLRDVLASTNRWGEQEREAFEQLNDDSTLVCWCAPAPCHGDIIEKVWREQNGLNNRRTTNVSSERDGTANESVYGPEPASWMDLRAEFDAAAPTFTRIEVDSETTRPPAAGTNSIESGRAQASAQAREERQT